MRIESQLFELKRHIEAAGVIAPSFFHWLSVDRWRPLRSAAGCSRTLPGGGVRRRARRGWHVIAKCEDGNSGHHDPDDKCRQEPSAAISVTERSLSVGIQAWIGRVLPGARELCPVAVSGAGLVAVGMCLPNAKTPPPATMIPMISAGRI